MATTLLKKFRDPVVAMHTAGTTIYLATQSGQVASYTISGGAVANVGRASMSDLTAIWADATYIYGGTASGRLLRYTIATGVHSQLAKLNSKITALTITGGILYISCANGRIYSYS